MPFNASLSVPCEFIMWIPFAPKHTAAHRMLFPFLIFMRILLFKFYYLEHLSKSSKAINTVLVNIFIKFPKAKIYHHY